MFYNVIWTFIQKYLVNGFHMSLDTNLVVVITDASLANAGTVIDLLC